MSEEAKRSNYITWGVGLLTVFAAWLLGYLYGKVPAVLAACAGATGCGFLLRGQWPGVFAKRAALAWAGTALIVVLVGGITWFEFPTHLHLTFTDPSALTFWRKAVINHDLDAFSEDLATIGFDLPSPIPPIDFSSSGTSGILLGGKSPYGDAIQLRKEQLDDSQAIRFSFALCVFMHLLDPQRIYHNAVKSNPNRLTGCGNTGETSYALMF